MKCTIAEENTSGKYYCTRAVGHSGPCAAVPASAPVVDVGMTEQIALIHIRKIIAERRYEHLMRFGRLSDESISTDVAALEIASNALAQVIADKLYTPVA